MITSPLFLREPGSMGRQMLCLQAPAKLAKLSVQGMPSECLQCSLWYVHYLQHNANSRRAKKFSSTNAISSHLVWRWGLIVRTNRFGQAKGETDERIWERHDRRHNGKPCHVVKIWNLRKYYLNGSKQQHVETISIRTWSFVSLFVVAIWFHDCPVLMCRNP